MALVISLANAALVISLAKAAFEIPLAKAVLDISLAKAALDIPFSKAALAWTCLTTGCHQHGDNIIVTTWWQFVMAIIMITCVFLLIYRQ